MNNIDNFLREVAKLKTQNDEDMMNKEDFDEGILDGWDTCLSTVYHLANQTFLVDMGIVDRETRIALLQEQIEALKAANNKV